MRSRCIARPRRRRRPPHATSRRRRRPAQLADPARLAGLPDTIEEFLAADPSAPLALRFNPAGTLLAAGCASGEVALWDWATRGRADALAPGHAGGAAALLWSRCGRRLASAGADGALALWDVAAGARAATAALGRGPVARLAAAPLRAPAGAPGFARGQRLAVSYAAAPPELLEFDGSGAPPARAALPVFALDGAGPAAALLSGAAAAGAGAALAELSPDGALVAVAGRGALALVAVAAAAAGGAALLDLVKLEGAPAILDLQFSEDGARLLVVAADRTVRVYAVAAGAAAGPARDAAAAAGARRPAAGGPLLPPAAGGAPPPLALARRFQAEAERGPWAAARLAPGGGALAAAPAGAARHLIYLFDLDRGAVSALEGPAGEGVAALEWHPAAAPAQLLAACAGGRTMVWARALAQRWSAFAPDFRDLAANDEYVEREDEFDVVVVEAEGAAGGGAAAAAAEGDAEVDAGGGARAAPPEVDGAPPLLTLPPAPQGPEEKADEAAAPEAAPEGGGGGGGATDVDEALAA